MKHLLRALLLLLLAPIAHAGCVLVPAGPLLQIFTDQGIVGSGYKINTYVAGSVNTALTTYTDSTCTVANSNPIVMGSNGRFQSVNIWVPSGTLTKLVLTDPNNVTITGGTIDNLPAIGDVSYPQTAVEAARSITPTNTSYVFGDLRRYSNSTTGNGSVDDTSVFNTWISAIAGQAGYLPMPSVNYNLPNGITISGQSGTKIRSDTYAKIVTTQTSGFAITITNCYVCDFEFGWIQAGYSGILINSTSSDSTNNHIGFTQLVGAGRQSTKPSDPMANRVGVYFQGPTVGNANYFNTIKAGSLITSFDTDVAMYTPAAVGAMNSNANILDTPYLAGYWYGIYINSVENMVQGAQCYSANGTDASHRTECIHLGDVTNNSYNANYNQITAVAEPGTFSQAMVAGSNSLNNIVLIQDNTTYGVSDSGTNTWSTHNLWQTNSVVTSTNQLGVVTITETAPTALTYGATISLNAATGTVFSVAANNNSAFTFNTPTNPTVGQRITIQVENSSGGALSATDPFGSANFKHGTWTQPANNFNRSITFEYGMPFAPNSWYEISRTPVDVAN